MGFSFFNGAKPFLRLFLNDDDSWASEDELDEDASARQRKACGESGRKLLLADALSRICIELRLADRTNIVLLMWRWLKRVWWPQRVSERSFQCGGSHFVPQSTTLAFFLSFRVLGASSENIAHYCTH